MPKITLFNHDVRYSRPLSTVGQEYYSGRALGISRSNDIIQLHPGMEPLWPAICGHYRRIGLEYSQNPVWNLSLELADSYPNVSFSPFLFTDAFEPDSRDAQWFRERDPELESAVSFINSKNAFIRTARELEVAVPETTAYEKPDTIDPSAVKLPCFLKSAISANGNGIFRCETLSQLEKALEELPENTAFQIQEELAGASFLNLQYFASRGRAGRVAATLQLVESHAHVGSVYPVDNPPWQVCDQLAQHLAKKGLKGIFAFDVASCGPPSEPRVLALECNPRFNGATYPTLVARKMGIDYWTCETFVTSARSLADLDLLEFEFDPSTREGIVLINWGPILSGRLGILLSSSREDHAGLKARLERSLL